MTEITDELLVQLRQRICAVLSPKRATHTLAVEDMVARLCALYCPEHTAKMRAAALLHDITKERSVTEQLELCSTYGIPTDQSDLLAPKTLHARTAAAQIPVEYPEFADPLIVSAVRWHTTGHAGMTLTEKLLYLADYIDASRTFRNCVILRRYFWAGEPQGRSADGRAQLLRDTLLLSYEMTLKDLIDENSPIASDTVAARNELLLEARAQ